MEEEDGLILAQLEAEVDDHLAAERAASGVPGSGQPPLPLEDGYGSGSWGYEASHEEGLGGVSPVGLWAAPAAPRHDGFIEQEDQEGGTWGGWGAGGGFSEGAARQPALPPCCCCCCCQPAVAVAWVFHPACCCA